MELIYKIFWRLKVVYCFLLRPVTLGVKGLVIDQDDRVLLVKHTYKPGWHIPGGAVDRRETALESVKRELEEEAGIVCKTEPEVWPGLFYNTGDFKNDHIVLFIVKDWQIDHSKKTAGEISDAQFFKADQLPQDISVGSRRRIEEYFAGPKQRFDW